MLQIIWRSLEAKGLSKASLDIISASWRNSTKKQYSSYIKKWLNYCKQKSENELHTSAEIIIEFLTHLFHKDMCFSSLNVARSALSTFVTLKGPHSVGNHPLISRFMKGVYQLRPPTTRYTEIWDVRVVFNYLRNLSPAKNLSLKQLTYKLVMLLALVSAQRVQSLHLLDLNNMQLKESSVRFSFSEHLKQDRIGRIPFTLRLSAYPPDRRLCAVTYLRHYISRTKCLRGTETRLCISFRKPFKRVTSQTIARWIKECMSAAGIDTDKFKAHSTKAAATSAAEAADLPISYIMNQAGWSSERTFQKYYKKPILTTDNQKFVKALLSKKSK